MDRVEQLRPVHSSCSHQLLGAARVVLHISGDVVHLTAQGHPQIAGPVVARQLLLGHLAAPAADARQVNAAVGQSDPVHQRAARRQRHLVARVARGHGDCSATYNNRRAAVSRRRWRWQRRLLRGRRWRRARGGARCPQQCAGLVDSCLGEAIPAESPFWIPPEEKPEDMTSDDME